VQRRRPGIALEYLHGGWWIDAGALHGVQPPVISAAGDRETTILAVWPPSPADGAGAARRPVGRVQVTDVGPTRSQVKPTGGWHPDPGVLYDATVVDVPLPLATVELRGRPEDVGLIRNRLASCAYVTEGQGQAGVHFVAAAGAGGLIVTRPDGTRITGPFAATAAGAAALAWRLEHLARWHLTRSLDNPLSRLAGQVTIDIVLAASRQEQPRRQGWAPVRPGPDGDIRLSYRRTDSGWEPPYIFIYLQNRSERSLYCALLDLTDGFRCHARLFPGDWIPPGGCAVAYEGRPVDVSIPRSRLDAGETEVRDWFKLIAAEHRFEVGAFELPDLSAAPVPRPVTRQRGTGSTLARLTSRAPGRDAGADAAGPSDWSTALVNLRTVLPAAQKPGQKVGDARGTTY
jgi:hypothetical protein